jgi:hypothetical protein
MGYGSKSLNDWSDDALRIAKEHGFEDASIAEDIALMHSELSEALEDVRDGKRPSENWYEEKIEAFYAGGPRIEIDGKPAFVSVRHVTPFPRTADGHLNPYKPCGIPSELADVIIRVLHFAGKHGVDIEQAVREKMYYNETRPYKHGGKKL